MWRDIGDAETAARYFQRALACDCSAPERRHLEKQLAELRVRPGLWNRPQ